MPLTTGVRVGPYEITGLLGAGGMGEVYRARDTRLKRDVALKLLPEAFAADDERLARFQREAEVLAALNHPNIATIHGIEDAPGDAGPRVRALVLELVEGDTLADRIARGPIPVDEALPIARQIADALEAAHEQGIVHRDLKPANIKVRDDGTVKMLDFGLAKLTGPAEGRPYAGSREHDAVASPAARGGAAGDVTASPTITSPAMMTGVGTLLGTAAYMSPEQAKGRPADKRSDIWAFGCVLYEMLGGRRAFDPSTGSGSSRAESRNDAEDVTETLAAVLRAEPDWTLLPRDVPPSVAAIVKGCLRKDRRERIGDAAAVQFLLREPALVSAVPSRPALSTRTLRRSAATAFGVMAVAALVAWWQWPSRPPGEADRFVHRLSGDQRLRGVDFPVVAVSHDGRSFVYNTDAGLFVRSMGALDARPIPGTATATTLSPFFSPDGQSVAYFDTAGRLMRVGLSGSAPQTICESDIVFGGSWGRDGNILFARPDGIARVPAAGGTPELIVRTEPGEQAFQPQWLPDGDSILFTLRTGDSWESAAVVVHSLSTNRRTRILERAADARYLPTGHLLYVTAGRLFAVPFDADRLQERGAAVEIEAGLAQAQMNGRTPAANYGVGDNGTLVFLARGESEGLIVAGSDLTSPVWVDRAGREEPLGMPPAPYAYPRLSTDGASVAIDTRGADRDIFVWDVRRRQRRQFTFGPDVDAVPVWGPEDHRLLWGRLEGGSALNLFWQAADGTGRPDRLTTSTRAQRPSAFTPDGKAVLLSEGGVSQQDIAILPLEGEPRVRPLIATEASEFNPVVSPNGRWMAYQSNQGGRFEIWVTSFPSLEGTWTVDDGEEPLWLPKTGAELFYLAPDGSLMSRALESGADAASPVFGPPVRVTKGDGYWKRTVPQLGRTYDVAADGRRFIRMKVADDAAAAPAGPDTFVIVLNWIEDLKRRVPAR